MDLTCLFILQIYDIFSTDSVVEMILNLIAMEFLMELDNEFEEMYFKFLPEVAEDIYDNFFVTFEDNKKISKKR